MHNFLLVDDNLALAENLAEILRDAGSRATVTHALDAVRLAADHQYDLLITDMRMPEMCGTELVRRLRELDPELPAIIITAYAGGANIDIVDGVIAVLPKPVPIAKLLELAAEAGCRTDS